MITKEDKHSCYTYKQREQECVEQIWTREFSIGEVGNYCEDKEAKWYSSKDIVVTINHCKQCYREHYNTEFHQKNEALGYW